MQPQLRRPRYDGVGTNDASSKRVWPHFSSRPPCVEGVRVTYAMVVFKCAPHQGNLAVLVALSGRLHPTAVDEHELVGNCVWLYKYMMPAYQEEYVANLIEYLLQHVKLVRHGSSADGHGMAPRRAQ